MRDAATVLSIIRERSERGLPLEDAYRLLYNPSLYLYAYGRISHNAGALTPGVTAETVDGMTLEKIGNLIALVRREAYHWTPVRRIHIPKKKGGTRSLGIPTWSDKLLQEAIRLILEAHYEPRFSQHSHGFRPDHGCHTALRDVGYWTGTKWFIEGDIKGCFDNIDHAVLLSILAETIHDNRFLRLIRYMLQAGYLENWVYGKTLSGTPQGGVASPILANVYLDQLDQFVEQHLKLDFTRGGRRRPNPVYARLNQAARQCGARGAYQERDRLIHQMRRLPSLDPNDFAYRRLRYVRYADDFLLGFSGPRAEAEEIKQQLGTFLHDTLRLELSPAKTLVTHAATECARFLGYDITVQWGDDYLCREERPQKRRRANGKVAFRVPPEVIRAYCQAYEVKGKPRKTSQTDSDFTIVDRYGGVLRGIYQYYRLAQNVGWLNRVQYALLRSLLHTLAAKHHTTVTAIVRRYKTLVETPNGVRTGYEVRLERPPKAPLIARFGGFALKREKRASIRDTRPDTSSHLHRNERIQRLLHEKCELCGVPGPVEGHHIHKLADLKQPGRKERPEWQAIMLARRRKTLFLCHSCHAAIHGGRIQMEHTE